MIQGQRIVPDKIILEDSVTEEVKNYVEDSQELFPSQSSILSDNSSESLFAGEEFLMYRRRMLNHINSLENIYLSNFLRIYLFSLFFLLRQDSSHYRRLKIKK